MDKNLKAIIDRSTDTKNGTLNLQSMSLTTLPDLSKLTWVTNLKLGYNNIKVIDIESLPPNLKILRVSHRASIKTMTKTNANH